MFNVFRDVFFVIFETTYLHKSIDKYVYNDYWRNSARIINTTMKKKVIAADSSVHKH